MLRRLMRKANEDENLRLCLTRLLLRELDSAFPGIGSLVRLRLSLSGVDPEEAEPEVVLDCLSRYGIDSSMLLAHLGALGVDELLSKHRNRLRKLCRRRKLL